MKIVVTKGVTMFVEKYVSYMKREGHYSQPALIRNKKNMLHYLRGFINKAVVANDNKTPKRYYCSWRDGQTPMTWIFYFIVLPQQDMTVIYGLTSKRSVEMPDRQIRENKDVKKILSLMERIEMLTEYKDHYCFGWDYKESLLRQNGADDETIELLHKAYDKYAEEEASKSEIPNNVGFDIWCREKDQESSDNGHGLRYPNYI